ncbi:MAG: hypothetical protein M1830_008816 [Pleopsidium flavum]|nr:MAG: hypothetical protein M1830_008816 [Pleopsidium flavum]
MLHVVTGVKAMPVVEKIHRRVLSSNSLLLRRAYSSFVQEGSSLRHTNFLRGRHIHDSPTLHFPRRRDFFSANATLQQQPQHLLRDGDSAEHQQNQKRKVSRSPAGKTSLRRVAVEAQRSRDGIITPGTSATDGLPRAKTVTAYCVAEQFNLPHVVRLLQSKGYELDPCKTELYPQVVHIQVPVKNSHTSLNSRDESTKMGETGDVFIFPSGTLVAWALPEGTVSFLATRILLPAAESPHVDQLETESLEYLEDLERETSSIKGDTIILGTKVPSAPSQKKPASSAHGVTTNACDASDEQELQRRNVDTVLAKIAFSSGLARSTKLAVLESLLSNYFESTRSIPTMLSRGSRLPFTRSFILRKTGQLLSVRAQLNLYSELTDSLPDLFWDSRHELGLEGYYDQVGRALDVGVRIKVLNEKMDYAQEIASVLRERLSEKHGLVLEWTIIALIAVEVGFEVLRLWKERNERLEKENKAEVTQGLIPTH